MFHKATDLVLLDQFPSCVQNKWRFCYKSLSCVHFCKYRFSKHRLVQ